MRVLIADDHRLIVEGVKRALEEAPDFEVVGECNSGSQVLPMVGRTNPDIVLLDLRMPGADGLACLSRIRKQHPDVKVVVLSVSTDENVIQTVLKRGASRSEEHTSELQSHVNLVCRLLLEKKKKHLNQQTHTRRR